MIKSRIKRELPSRGMLRPNWMPGLWWQEIAFFRISSKNRDIGGHKHQHKISAQSLQLKQNYLIKTVWMDRAQSSWWKVTPGEGYWRHRRQNDRGRKGRPKRAEGGVWGLMGRGKWWLRQVISKLIQTRSNASCLVLEGCCRQNRQRAHRGLSPEIRYIYSTATFTLTNF